MDWMNQLGDLLQRYGSANPQSAPASVDDDFEHVSRSAPPSAMADGLAAAFRSDQTPPFGSMLAQMFGQSSGLQRASMLNTLISVAGPALLAQLAAKGGGGGGLSDLLSGGTRHVTPEMAEQVSPEVVEQIASHAEQRDPSIIDRVSDFYSQQPALMKGLGAAALTLAMARIAQHQTGRR